MVFHAWEVVCRNRDLWLESFTWFMCVTATPAVNASDLLLHVTFLIGSLFLFQTSYCIHASMRELFLPSEMAAPCHAASCYLETINSLLVIAIMLHLYLVIREHLLP